MFLPLIFLSCSVKNEYEINVKIKPKILGFTSNTLSIEYKLGNLLILDDLTDLNPSHVLYIDQNKNIELKLKIHYQVMSDDFSTDAYFRYSIGETVIATTNPKVFKNLMDHADEIEGFKWKIKHGVKVSDQSPKSDTESLEDNQL